MDGSRYDDLLHWKAGRQLAVFLLFLTTEWIKSSNASVNISTTVDAILFALGIIDYSANTIRGMEWSTPSRSSGGGLKCHLWMEFKPSNWGLVSSPPPLLFQLTEEWQLFPRPVNMAESGDRSTTFTTPTRCASKLRVI